MQEKLPLMARLKSVREKYLPYNEKTLRRLVAAAMIMYSWILIWALVFKMGNETILKNLYANLKDLTLKERILWDIIPFNYRPEEGRLANLIMDTVLNCFAFAPFGVFLSYVFKKSNVLRDFLICFGFSAFIEILQLVTMLGNPATEDLITNTFGYFIGFGLYMLLFKRLSQKHTVITAVIVNIIFAVASVYAIVSTVGAAELIFKIATKTL